MSKMIASLDMVIVRNRSNKVTFPRPTYDLISKQNGLLKCTCSLIVTRLMDGLHWTVDGGVPIEWGYVRSCKWK